MTDSGKVCSLNPAVHHQNQFYIYKEVVRVLHVAPFKSSFFQNLEKPAFQVYLLRAAAAGSFNGLVSLLPGESDCCSCSPLSGVVVDQALFSVPPQIAFFRSKCPAHPFGLHLPTCPIPQSLGKSK